MEIVKKIIDISILIISAFFGVYAIAWGCVLFNAICVLVNLAPNKRLLNYGIREQIIDAVPTFLIALTMGCIIYWVQMLDLSNIEILFLQFVFGCIIYVGLSWLFKEESFVYILQMYKDNKNKRAKKNKWKNNNI